MKKRVGYLEKRDKKKRARNIRHKTEETEEAPWEEIWWPVCRHEKKVGTGNRRGMKWAWGEKDDTRAGAPKASKGQQ